MNPRALLRTIGILPERVSTIGVTHRAEFEIAGTRVRVDWVHTIAEVHTRVEIPHSDPHATGRRAVEVSDIGRWVASIYRNDMEVKHPGVIRDPTTLISGIVFALYAVNGKGGSVRDFVDSISTPGVLTDSSRARPRRVSPDMVAASRRVLLVDKERLGLTEIKSVSLVEPWPRIAIRHWKGLYYAVDTFAPKRASDAGAFERAALEVIHALRPSGVQIEEGWSIHPSVPWTPASEFPARRDRSSRREGGYRHAEPDPEFIVAERDQAGRSFERLLAWLIADKERLPQHNMEEFVLSDRSLYGRTREGDIFKLPLESLRRAEGEGSQDRLYTFGRGTRVYIPYRPDCAVTKGLDAMLL